MCVCVVVAMGKRVYGGYGSPDFTPKKARMMGMSYRYKKRSSRKGGRGSMINSTKGGSAGSLYRTKRLSRKQYRRKLYESLRFQEKYRSVYSASGTVSLTATAADKKTWYRYDLPDNFYEAAGGFTGSQTFTTSKFIIKGGQLYVSLRNDNAETCIIEWGAVRYVNSAAAAAINGVETECTYDLSNFSDFGTGFKVVKRMRRIILEPNAQVEMRVKFPFTVINDITQWNDESYGKYAIVYSIHPTTITASSFARVLGHNLTFVADAIA